MQNEEWTSFLNKKQEMKTFCKILWIEFDYAM